MYLVTCRACFRPVATSRFPSSLPHRPSWTPTDVPGSACLGTSAQAATALLSGSPSRPSDRHARTLPQGSPPPSPQVRGLSSRCPCFLSRVSHSFATDARLSPPPQGWRLLEGTRLSFPVRGISEAPQSTGWVESTSLTNKHLKRRSE